MQIENEWTKEVHILKGKIDAIKEMSQRWLVFDPRQAIDPVLLTNTDAEIYKNFGNNFLR